MFNHTGARLFRGVYSPYFKIQGRIYYCVPLTWKDYDINIEDCLYRSENIEENTFLPITPKPFSYLQDIDSSVVNYDLLKEANGRLSNRKQGPPTTSYLSHRGASSLSEIR